MPAALEVPTDLHMDRVSAMERLSPPYREVLILRDVHELKAPEVAAHLGLSPEAVKSRLQARAQVREHLLPAATGPQALSPMARRRRPNPSPQPDASPLREGQS